MKKIGTLKKKFTPEGRRYVLITDESSNEYKIFNNGHEMDDKSEDILIDFITNSKIGIGLEDIKNFFNQIIPISFVKDCDLYFDEKDKPHIFWDVPPCGKTLEKFEKIIDELT